MRLGETIDTPEDHCPACGYKTDAAACVGEDASPSPGDLSICANCCAWLVFDAALQLQPVSGQLLHHVHTDPFCRLTEQALRMRKAERN